MARALLILITVFALFALFPAKSHAVYDPFPDEVCQGEAAQSPNCKKGATTSSPLTGPNGVLVKVTRLVAFAAGLTAVVIIIIAGFKYILSMGESGAVSGAKNTIIYAVVGLVVIVLAQFIVTFVVSRL